MSVSITQQPTSPNVANTKLLYVVSSSLTSNPQYKYVADVFLSGSSTRLDRLKTIPNPAGDGIFDISVEVINNLDYDNNWKTTSTLSTGSSKIFIVKFGEEYGTSPSSSVTIYDGAGSPGDPSVTSNNLLAINGVVNPAEINSFNFDYEKFDTSSFTSVNQGNVAATYNDLRGPKLSNYPYGWQNATGSVTHPISIDTSDYETISFLRLNPISSASYTSSSLYVYYDNPISLFTSSFVIDTNAGTTDVLTLRVGPQNLMSISSDISSSFTGSWSLYEVEVKYQNSKNGNEASSSYWYMNEDLCNTDFPIQLSDETLVTYTWTTKNALPFQQLWMEGAGTVDAAWSVGGEDTGSFYSNHHLIWDGTNWSIGSTANYAAFEISNVGTVNDAFAMGGNVAPFGSAINSTQYYNGVSWAADTPMLLPRNEAPSVGDYTEAMVIGGGIGSTQLTSEYWSGSVWTLGPVPSFNITDGGSAGVLDDFIISRNQDSGLYALSYNGVSFSTIPAPNFQGDWGSGAGSSNSLGLVWGGESGSGGSAITLQSTELWSGSVWNTMSNLNAGRYQAGSAGTHEYALTWGGRQGGIVPGSYLSSTEEFFTFYYNEELRAPLQGKNPLNKGLYDGIRFAFINQYGTWDYYTIYGPTSKNTKVKRENVVLSQADYSAASSVYDISRRSKTQYYASLSDEISITTEYLEEDEANWLTELFESPLIFEQSNDDFIPVVITNAEYMWKTENKNKKLFQYTIRYKRSNERRSRL